MIWAGWLLVTIATAAEVPPAADSIKQCPPFTDQHTPQNIHQLRADSIRMIMGLGDSAMAAFGAKPFSLLDGTPFMQEYRGHSFIMGGDRDAPSLANYLAWYREEGNLPEGQTSLLGASRGAHPVQICAGSFWCPPDELAYRPHQDNFNAALSGAQINNLGLESKYLLQQLHRHPQVNITADWKLLAVFIGTNDLCQMGCKATFNPEELEERLFQTLELIRSKVPRTLVSLLQLPDVSQLSWFANRHKRCLPVQAMLRLECPCAMGSSDDQWALRTAIADFNLRLKRVAQRLNERIWQEQNPAEQDWAVLVMPLLKDTSYRDDIPHHFATKLDCFHPSLSAHRSMAMALWEQLWQPAAERTSHLREQSEIYCPKATDFIRTD